MPPLYSIGKVTVGPALLLGWRPKVEGKENVPAAGGVILAANHLSVADEYFLGAVLPRHVAFWAKAEYFVGTGFRGLVTRSLVTGLGAIRVERGGGRAALSAFDGAIPVLAAGGQVAVFPEGTRSPDGRLYRGRTGVARLALAAGVPVVPVGFAGTDEIQPIGTLWPKLKRGKAVVRFGKPMDFTGRSDDRAEMRRITDEVMAEIQRLTGQEYVPRYAPPRTAAGGAGPATSGEGLAG
ncbi:lysophospholipid acyltransferase family protein [Micromonospora sp. LOL_023]|uniref:lysophospholipid acyltransferase family protein n=1 Tax=Micromonospora sp. LOL_023 TaxID=3345418 RepID=UPI003A891A3A